LKTICYSFLQEINNRWWSPLSYNNEHLYSVVTTFCYRVLNKTNKYLSAIPQYTYEAQNSTSIRRVTWIVLSTLF